MVDSSISLVSSKKNEYPQDVTKMLNLNGNKVFEQNHKLFILFLKNQ